MGDLRVGVLAVGVMVLSGCASLQVSQEISRLESRLAQIDERVGQLEHVRTSEPSTASVIENDVFEIGLTSSSATEGDLFKTEPSVSEEASSIAAPTTMESPAVKPTIREIQEALQNAGFYQGKVDGKMGPLTREAIREFQRMSELKVDGLVGKRTWAKLRVYTDSSIASGELGAAEILK